MHKKVMYFLMLIVIIINIHVYLYKSIVVLPFEKYDVGGNACHILCNFVFFPRFRNFPHERQLWEEVQGMLEALQTDSSEHGHTLLTGILFFPHIYITNVMEDMDIHSTGSLFFSIYKKKK